MRFFTLAIFQPLPLDSIAFATGLDGQIDTLKWTTTVEGGFGALECTLAPSRLQRLAQMSNAVQIPYFGHVVLKASGAGMTLFEGRVVEVTRAGDGTINGFVAEGYGISAMQDAAYVNTSVTLGTSGSVLKDVLMKAAPLIVLGTDGVDFVDPAISHAPNDYPSLYPSSIVDQMRKEGGGGPINALWDFTVWEGRKARFLPRAVPATVDYRIGFDETVTAWKENCRTMYASTVVRYTPPGGSATVTAASSAALQNAFIATYRVNRQAIYEAGSVVAAFATQLRDTMEELNNAPQISCTVTRDGTRGLELATGADYPAALVRAGQWVQVGGTNVSHNYPPLIILKASYDAKTEVASYDLGFAPRDYYSSVRTLVALSAYLKRLASPISGARQM